MDTPLIQNRRLKLVMVKDIMLSDLKISVTNASNISFKQRLS